MVVNNQIGFTTSPAEGRSSTYATDVAKMLQIPIFHVNGEDPEAVAQVVRLAMDFRREFQRDVVIDMYCYRRRGHNEGDEPAFTQPVLYRAIEQRTSVRDGYLDHLLKLGDITRDEADRIAARADASSWTRSCRSPRSDEYVAATDSAHRRLEGLRRRPRAPTCPRSKPAWIARPTGGVAAKSRRMLPADFHPHPKIERFLECAPRDGPRRAAARLVRRRSAGASPAWPRPAIACA